MPDIKDHVQKYNIFKFYLSIIKEMGFNLGILYMHKLILSLQATTMANFSLITNK